jgi:hypothetical protein
LSNFKEPEFHERQNAAAAARRAMLEKYRTRPGPDDPAVQRRQAEREAIQSARRARAAEREAAQRAREEEFARQAAIEA